MRGHWDGDELMTSFFPHTATWRRKQTAEPPQTCDPRPAPTPTCVHPNLPLPLLPPVSTPWFCYLGCPRAVLLGTAATGPTHLASGKGVPEALPSWDMESSSGLRRTNTCFQTFKYWSSFSETSLGPWVWLQILLAGSRPVVGTQEAALHPPARWTLWAGGR